MFIIVGKIIFFTKYIKYICVYQKFVVPLQPIALVRIYAHARTCEKEE